MDAGAVVAPVAIADHLLPILGRVRSANASA